MANIGTFTRDGDKLTGAINTLAMKAKATFQPIEKKSERMPDYRIYAGGVEVGAAWQKTSENERPYLAVKLDDPSFGTAIYCRLIEAEDGRHLVEPLTTCRGGVKPPHMALQMSRFNQILANFTLLWVV